MRIVMGRLTKIAAGDDRWVLREGRGRDALLEVQKGVLLPGLPGVGVEVSQGLVLLNGLFRTRELVISWSPR